MSESHQSAKNTLCDPASNRRSIDSGSVSVKCATGPADVSNQVTQAHIATGRSHCKLGNQIHLGTWNVRGLLQTGKLHILEREIRRENLLVCGISETHWKGNGHFNKADHTIYISGADETGRNGVAFLVNKKCTKYVEGYEAISDRLIRI